MLINIFIHSAPFICFLTEWRAKCYNIAHDWEFEETLIMPYEKKRIANTAGFYEQRKKIKNVDPRSTSISVYLDAIYRAHDNFNQIFGKDVSFCHGHYNRPSDENSFGTTIFSEMAEGCFVFEMIPAGNNEEERQENYDIFEASTNPIGDHHLGTGRGNLFREFMTVTRIFYDPTDFDEADLKQQMSIIHRNLEISPAENLFCPINRKHIIEYSASSSNPSIIVQPTHSQIVSKSIGSP